MESTLTIIEKRLRNEVKDLKKHKLEFAQAIQDETNKFIFYFLLVGDKEDPKSKAKTGHYEGGYYLGKIMLPPNYPEKPGDFMMLTPNGRFEIGKKICLTNSGYHTESWTPAWSIRNMLLGFASIFYVDLDTGISHIKMDKLQRQELAKNSIKFNIDQYKDIFVKFDQFIEENGNVKQQPTLNTITEEHLVKTVDKPMDKSMDKPIDKPEIHNKDDDFEQILAKALKDSLNEHIKKDADDEELQKALKQIQEMEKLEQKKQENNTMTQEKINISNETDINETEKSHTKTEKPTKIKKLKKTSDKTNAVSENKNSQQILKTYLNDIKNMTYQNFDINVFNIVQKMIGLKNIE